MAYHSVLVAVATGVHQPLTMSQVHQVGSEGQVGFSIHHHRMLPCLKCHHGICSSRADRAGVLHQDSDSRTTSHQFAVFANRREAAANGVLHFRRRISQLVGKPLHLGAADGPLRHEVRHGDAFQAGSHATLVQSPLPIAPMPTSPIRTVQAARTTCAAWVSRQLVLLAFLTSLARAKPSGVFHRRRRG